MSDSIVWGDVEEKEDNEYSKTIDDKGIITEVFVRVDEDGKRFKVTKKYKETKKAVRVNKHVEARKKWKKFGDCLGLPPGPETNITYQTVDLVELDLMKKEEKEVEQVNLVSSTVCRRCGQSGHWTIQCPNFSTETKEEKEKPERRARMGQTTGLASGSSGKYVAPKGRFGGGGDRNFREEENATLRVTNLSEDTTEHDLRELFQPFGRTTRIYLAKDRATGLSRGLAFINYASRSSAQAAMERLHGHGYDSLILHVEWAKPRDHSAGNNTQAIQNAQRRRF